MKYTVSIKNTSHRMPYSLVVGPYTRKSDAIKGLSRMNIPNIKNADIVIIASENHEAVYAEVMTELTDKVLTTNKLVYKTQEIEENHTYKFNY